MEQGQQIFNWSESLKTEQGTLNTWWNISKISNIPFFKTNSECSSVGGGRTPEGSSRPEIGKIGVEIWSYLPHVYSFGYESEIQEIFSKNVKKVNFP